MFLFKSDPFLFLFPMKKNKNIKVLFHLIEAQLSKEKSKVQTRLCSPSQFRRMKTVHPNGPGRGYFIVQMTRRAAQFF